MLDFLPLIIIEAHECLICCRVIDDRSGSINCDDVTTSETRSAT